MRHGGPDLATDQGIGELLRNAAELEGSDARQIDRSELVAEHDGILRLAGVPPRKRHLPGVPWRAGRDGADRGHARSMECLVRHDENPSATALFVTDSRVELGDDDRPAERPRHSGQDSAYRSSR